MAKIRIAAVTALIGGAGFFALVRADQPAHDPFISEFLASNRNNLADRDGDFPDWIELHNPGLAPLDLKGWHLTDDRADLTRWRFPSVLIPPQGYLVVFASGKNRAAPGQELHTNFRLDAQGEYLALVKPDGRSIPSEFHPAYPGQTADVSFGLAGPQQLYFARPTPGTSNTAGARSIAARPKFSHERGFYEAPFDLIITSETKDAVIRYTTNGIAPTAASGQIYRSPVKVRGTTYFRAAAYKENHLPSPVVTHTFLFLDDVIRQSPDGQPPPGWPERWGKNTVDYGMDPEVVNDPRYRDSIKSDLQSIPSFSLVMALEDLFDPARGIYANAREDGRAWERPCSVELIHPDETPGFQIEAGVRIRGGFSRSERNPKHAFRLFFRGEYGAPKLNYPLFGRAGADSFDAIDLRTFQNYSWSFFGDKRGVFVRDQVARDTQLAMGQPAKRGEFYHLYLNGQYWGLYNTDERSEASYAESYWGGSKEDYDVIKVEPFVYQVQPTDGNMEAWSRLYALGRAGFASHAAYQRLQGRNPDGTRNPAYENLLDVPNLIDYMLAIFYGGNLDAPVSWFLNHNLPNNFYAARHRRGEEGFRFFVHDAEHTLLDWLEDRTGPYLAGESSILQSNPQWLFQRLEANPEFRLRVADHIQRHFFGSGALTAKSMTQRFLKRIREIERAVVAESARWGDAQRDRPLTRDVEWTNTVREIVDAYLPRRTEVVLNQLRRRGLFPIVAAPSFDPQGGWVAPETTLAMSAPVGTVYFTVNGADPRRIGGVIAPLARLYEGPIAITEGMQVRARTLANGIWSALREASFIPQQNLSDLVITEIMYHPPRLGDVDGDAYEFLELQNLGPRDLDLSGVHLSDAIEFHFPVGFKAAPGEHLVLVRDAERFAEKHPNAPVHGVYAGALANSGERIVLKAVDGTVLSSIAYSDRAPWPTAADGGGFSLVRVIPPSTSNPGEASHWRASSQPGGSPGLFDIPGSIKPVWINEVMPNPKIPDLAAIELHNPNAESVDLGHWHLSDARDAPRGFQFPDGTRIPAGGYLVLTDSVFAPHVRLRPEGGQLYLFSADAAGQRTGFSDGFRYGAARSGMSFGRHVTSSGQVFHPAQASHSLGKANTGPAIGPVVIQEILPANPIGMEEFVELKNLSDKSITLFDERHRSAAWRLTGVEFEFAPGTVLPAGGILLVVNSDPAAYRTRHQIDPSVSVLGPFRGHLTPGGERVQLLQSDLPTTPLKKTEEAAFHVVDEVRYRSRSPWPTAPPGAIRSLERVDPRSYGNDPKNWRLSPGRPSPGADQAVNRAPRVQAGGELPFLVDRFPVALPLRGTVEDDGLPLNAGNLAMAWSIVSGPGPAAIRRFRAPATEATFFLPGKYQLRLSANDGALSSSDLVTVTIRSSVVKTPGDFDRDNHADLLLQNEEGIVGVWFMEGPQLKAGSLFNPSSPGDSNWRLAGGGDFNRDGESDLLFQHLNGSLSVWLMNGLTSAISGLVSPPAPDDPRWRVAGLPDLDGDGRTDLLFQHASGALVVWTMNGVLLKSSRFLTPNHSGDAAWKVAGTGQFDGDGRDDILFQHTDGTLAVWFMNGTELRESAFLTPKRPGDDSWRVASTIDLNSDGQTDLVFQQEETGALGVWFMEGIELQSAQMLTPGATERGWKIVGP